MIIDVWLKQMTLPTSYPVYWRIEIPYHRFKREIENHMSGLLAREFRLCRTFILYSFFFALLASSAHDFFEFFHLVFFFIFARLLSSFSSITSNTVKRGKRHFSIHLKLT